MVKQGEVVNVKWLGLLLVLRRDEEGRDNLWWQRIPPCMQSLHHVRCRRWIR